MRLTAHHGGFALSLHAFLLAGLLAASCGRSAATPSPVSTTTSPEPTAIPAAAPGAALECEFPTLIPCEDRVVRLAVEIPDTGLRLQYASDRTPAAGNDARALGLGGWTFDALDVYDVSAGVQHSGAGRSHAAQAVAPPSGPAAGHLLIASPDATEVSEFDSSGRHIATRDALTGAILLRFAYDAAGRVLSITDAAGNATTIERDAQGAPQAIIGASGFRTELHLTLDGFLDRIVPQGRPATSMTVDSRGLITEFIDAVYDRHAFEYDGDGRLTRYTDPAGNFTTLQVTSKGVVVTSPLGRTWTYTAERLGEGSLRRSVVGPAGDTTEMLLSADGSLTIEYPSELRRIELRTPDPRWGVQAPTTTSLELVTPSGLHWRQTAALAADLDDPADPFSLSRLTAERTVSGATYRRTFDAASNTITTSGPDGREDVLALDQMGRVVRTQRGDLTRVDVAYDDRGRLTSVSLGGAPSRLFEWTYTDGLVSVRNPLDEVARVQYDNGGSPIWYAAGDGAAVGVAMDGLGRLRSVSPPGHASYNLRRSPSGLVTTLELPVPQGQSALAPIARSLDADGGLTRLSGPAGTAASLTYDDAGRLATEQTDSGTVTTTYEGASTRVHSIVGPGGESIAYTWDGPLMVGEAWAGPAAGTVERTFDDDFHVIRQTVNGIFPIEYTYDNRARTVGVGDLTLQYGPLERPSRARLGNLVTSWSYDDDGLPIVARVSLGNQAIYEETNERDALGRITRQSIRVDGDTSEDRFTYDTGGRLQSVQSDAQTTTFAYDLAGNRVTTRAGGIATQAAFDGLDRQLTMGLTRFTYDDAGFLVRVSEPDGTTGYRYDSVGRLMGVDLPDGRRLDYELDGLGRRVGVRLDGTLVRGFLYTDALRPIAELDGSGEVVNRFVYSAAGRVPEYMLRGGRTYAIITDQLGSVRLVIDAESGEIAQRLDYDGFGRVLVDTAPGFQPFGFAGGLYDPLSGLVHFGMREYDPATGRFTTPDPLGFAGGDTNLYRYALGDPQNRIDPTGTGEGPTDDEPTIGESEEPGLPNTAGISLGGGFGIGGHQYVWGWNAQYFPGSDWAIYNYVSRPGASNEGVTLGFGVSANVGWFQGEAPDNLPGSWTELFETKAVSKGPISIGEYKSSPDQPGWSGLELGFSKGPLPASYSKVTTHYQCTIGCGSANGDPHVRTGDGLAYEFQAAGEFIAVESDAGDLVVQIRTEPYGTSTVVSVVTAAALDVAGDRIGFYVGEAIEVRLDGRPTEVTTPIRLPGGGSLERTEAGYRVNWPDGSRVDVSAPLGRALDVIVDLAAERENAVQGLLGDQDGESEDDLTTRDGRRLALPDLHSDSYDDIVYRTFAESWRIDPSESLFDYPPGASTATYTLRDFPSAVVATDDLAPDVRSSAEATCRRAGVSRQPFLDACVIDLGLTGDAGFTTSAARSQDRTVPPSPTQTFTIALGDTVAPDRPVAGTGHIDSGDETHEYAFPARAGQSWYLGAAPDCDAVGLLWNLVDPDGAPVRDSRGGLDEPLCVDLGRFTAPADGTYAVRVRAAAGSPGGEFAFALTPVHPDVQTTIRIGDSVGVDNPVPGAGRLAIPGAVHRFTFEALAGDAIYLKTAGCAEAAIIWRLFDPAGSPLPAYREQTCLDLGRFDVPSDGTYTIVIGEGGPEIGPYGFTLTRISPDGTFTVRPGETIGAGRPGPGAGRIETPGSADWYTFPVTDGDSIAVEDLVTGAASCSDLRWDLLDPSGSGLYTDQILCAGAERPPIEASVSGTYTLRVRGDGASVGTYGLKIVLTR